MAICRSCGARETWVIEYYNHPAPPALRSDDADSNDPLFAHPSNISPLRGLGPQNPLAPAVL
jgi:hypothetical protein